MGEKKILSVGVICTDIINVCTHYPIEDSDQRCISQRWSIGGNAANISTVLAQLTAKDSPNVKVECLGTIAEGPMSQFLFEDFAKYGILTDHIITHKNVEPACSCVIVNATNGSRTIVHSNRNLPDLSVADFEKLSLSDYEWIHFEGRNLENVKAMIRLVEKYNNDQPNAQGKITVSVEVEKFKPGMEELLGLGDYVFISKDYAKHRGFNDMHTAVTQLYHECKQGSSIICVWGDMGAAAMSTNDCLTTKSYPPEKIVDTLGAGDTFIAATIYYLLCGKLCLASSLQEACKIAGYKCGIDGLHLNL